MEPHEKLENKSTQSNELFALTAFWEKNKTYVMFLVSRINDLSQLYKVVCVGLLQVICFFVVVFFNN